MKKNIFFIAIITFACTLSVSAQNIVVKINFDGQKTNATHYVKWHEGITALSALQYCSNVNTHKSGNSYVFVSSIDDVKAQKGETAWYYKVNNKSPKILAIKNILTKNDTITWIFKKDICSKKISNSCCKDRKKCDDDKNCKSNSNCNNNQSKQHHKNHNECKK